MKKLLLFLLFTPFFQLTGQICTIDNTQTAVGLYPDTLPTGYVGQPYDTDITFVMPLDTLGYDFTNFKILSVALPVGLSWQCNNDANGCNYNPQVSQYGCVNISGTPLLAGQYLVDVTVLADLTVVSGYPFVFQIYMEILPSNVSTTNDGFTMIGASGCSPITVEFENNNPGLLSYSWDFGNGNISTSENPAPQVYTAPGDYVVHYEAYDNLDVIQVYTFTGITVNSMTNYGAGFPSYDNADTYWVLRENGTPIYNSSIIGDQNPPVSWTTSILLAPANTYTLHVYEADDSFGEVLLGADDYMGQHTVMLTGCTGCATSGGDSGSSANINYTVTNQTINPSPVVVSEDTVHVYGYPPVPVVSYNTTTNVLTTPDLGYGYQWYFNGSPIGWSTSNEHPVFQSGVYYVVAVNEFGCVSFSDTITAVYCNPNYTPSIQLSANSSLVIINSQVDYSIQWSLNGNEIAGAANDTIVATDPGAYTVTLTDSFGCVYTSNAFNVNLGIADIQDFTFIVFPNPANTSCTIQTAHLGIGLAGNLMDMTGRVIETFKLENGSYVLDLSDMRAGSYLIEISDGTNRKVKHLIKE
jgi:hypothetical protein